MAFGGSVLARRDYKTHLGDEWQKEGSG